MLPSFVVTNGHWIQSLVTMRIIIITAIFLCFNYAITADKPCVARQIPGRSVVCVCNETYCDEIVRQPPSPGQYVVYTSSESGLRFQKSSGYLYDQDDETLNCCPITINLDPLTRYQSIEGFGGAVTDSAAINWKSLTKTLQNYLVDSYAGEGGLLYNMLRVPIGGCDFSTHAYAYNELPVNDTHLTNYTLAPEDINFKIPLIKALSAAAKESIHIVATTWSPPPWMKTSNAFSGYSRLKHEYYQTYADYHLKFIQRYKEAGVPVWAITTTNEPIDGILGAPINTLGWSIEDMGKWIAYYLGPTIRNSTFSDVKIFTCDDQRFTVPFWFNVMLREHPKALEYLYGVAVHFYADMLIPAEVLSTVTKTFPDKVILATEACEGSFPWQENKVELGSWHRAVSYITDIIEDLNHYVVGWIDWNLCLNEEGGPNWVKNFVDSPIIVNATGREFVKQPMYYAMGHVSKFVPRGSFRIKLTETNVLFKSSVLSVAFLTPSQTLVLVMYNRSSERNVKVRIGVQHAIIHLEAHSITTVEFLSK